MTRMSVVTAAQMIEAAYRSPGDLPTATRLHISGADAHLLRDGVLVIPGTNERSDWIRFNLAVHVQPQMRVSWLTMVPREELKFWHMGFMQHAENLLRHLPRKPTFIIGHSLGGASAQILACHLGVPAIAFGTPKTYRRQAKRRGEDGILCYCRDDDKVRTVPTRVTGFRHLGRYVELSPPVKHVGEDHSLTNYLELLRDAQIMAGLDTEWPRAA